MSIQRVRHPGAGYLALGLAALLCSFRGVRAAQAVVSVSTPEQLLEAMASAVGPGAAENTVVELQQSVVLTQAAAAGYSLPFIIESNHTLTLRPGELKAGPGVGGRLDSRPPAAAAAATTAWPGPRPAVACWSGCLHSPARQEAARLRHIVPWDCRRPAAAPPADRRRAGWNSCCRAAHRPVCRISECPPLPCCSRWGHEEPGLWRDPLAALLPPQQRADHGKPECQRCVCLLVMRHRRPPAPAACMPASRRGDAALPQLSDLLYSSSRG